MRTLALILALSSVALAGCRSPRVADADAGRTSATVSAYDRAFDVARDVLREHRFELERVDARAGVITTRPRAGAGLATPWVPTSEPLRDLAHRDARVVTVAFAPADAPPVDDLRAHEGAVSIEWRIEVRRAYVPGRRPSPTSINMGGAYRTRDLPTIDGETRYATIVDNDETLAARLLASMLERLAPPDNTRTDTRDAGTG